MNLGSAVVNNGYRYISTDSGATWTEITDAGSRNWRGITSSSDGAKLAVVADNNTNSHNFTTTRESYQSNCCKYSLRNLSSALN